MVQVGQRCLGVRHVNLDASGGHPRSDRGHLVLEARQCIEAKLGDHGA